MTAWFMESSSDEHETDDMLIIILLTIHSLSYLAGLFRTYDINTNGKADFYGVPRAPTESALKSIEVLIQCIVFGHVLTKQYMMTAEEFHHNAYTHYFIQVDMFIMFLSLGYTYFTKLLCVKGEVLKNISTMSFLQKDKIAKQDKPVMSWLSMGKSKVAAKESDREALPKVADTTDQGQDGDTHSKIEFKKETLKTTAGVGDQEGAHDLTDIFYKQDGTQGKRPFLDEILKDDT